MNGKKGKMYLAGAHVWVSYIPGCKPLLYDFITYDPSGIFYFKSRQNGILIAKTTQQLYNYSHFKPFLINFDFWDEQRLVTFGS